MALSDDLLVHVKDIFRSQWSTRDGTKVPDTPDLKLTNDAVKLNATVLYADLAGSTMLVNTKKSHYAAEVYKSYLLCASKIIAAACGVITAFDGDRVMAVFIGTSKNTSAAKCGMQINNAVINVINPALKAQYPNDPYVVRQVVGVDTSDLFVARTGIRGSNDLVWVGRAANYAAKLSSINEQSISTYITADVYNNMNAEIKVYNNQQVWTSCTWTAMNKFPLYKTNWYWGY